MKPVVFVFALCFPALSVAAPKVDLSLLGKKPSQTTETSVSGSSIEEEVISGQVYTSGSSEIGARRNVELVKPQAKDLTLNKPKAVANEKSALAFVDEALGIEPVKPWEKGTLAKKEMKPGGPVPEFDLFSEKVFSYKQGSVGGSGVGGGGCGCN
ncbi:DUF4266 domain-containing protein [Vibrio coralliilyticus]|uniref:DUF4266 domain-containing protein n=1 Tax=Vibrio coralliilyticus TaxID=190893 RepID=UPI0005128AA5|nr:DUF4266 domain-containing protein [Vibrio coralliilyticus]AIS57622.1 hypothetical protein JV59_21775 [Vibrio coralliilyticus]PAU40000.1 DUF4266 domain-containing protein [Vibrio coralliilyticus]